MKDQNAAQPVDRDALLIHGSVAVLTAGASAALLAEHGWRDLSPSAVTRMTIEALPLHVNGVDDAGPLPTTGTLHVVVGPDQAAIVAVEVAGASGNARADDEPVGTAPESSAGAGSATRIGRVAVASDDPRRPILTPTEEWGDLGTPTRPIPFPAPVDPFDDPDPVEASPLCHFFPGLSSCRRR